MTSDRIASRNWIVRGFMAEQLLCCRGLKSQRSSQGSWYELGRSASIRTIFPSTERKKIMGYSK